MNTAPYFFHDLNCAISTALLCVGSCLVPSLSHAHPLEAKSPLKITVSLHSNTANLSKLSIVLSNESREIVMLDGNCVPMREGGCGLNFVAIPDQIGSRPLSQLVAPSNAPGEIKLKPMERIQTQIALDDRFPKMQHIRRKSSVLLFWWYQPSIAVGSSKFFAQPHQGGMVVLPRIVKRKN
jgi:hypothetical protein